MVEKYPKAENAKNALFNLGFAYEKLGKPEKMAEANERYSQMYPGEKDVGTDAPAVGSVLFASKNV